MLAAAIDPAPSLLQLARPDFRFRLKAEAAAAEPR
jgi:hypothetical protein